MNNSGRLIIDKDSKLVYVEKSYYDLANKEVSEMIWEKYNYDREMFCYNVDNVNNILISLSKYSSNYYICNDYLLDDDKMVNNMLIINLFSDKDGIVDNEYEFIREYISYILGKLNHKLEIRIVDDYLQGYGYLIESDEIRVYISKDKTLEFIISLVKQYNNDREKCYVRQLKMEGF